jgi:hypothetical protein
MIADFTTEDGLILSFLLLSFDKLHMYVFSWMLECYLDISMNWPQ